MSQSSRFFAKRYNTRPGLSFERRPCPPRQRANTYNSPTTLFPSRLPLHLAHPHSRQRGQPAGWKADQTADVCYMPARLRLPDGEQQNFVPNRSSPCVHVSCGWPALHPVSSPAWSAKEKESVKSASHEAIATQTLVSLFLLLPEIAPCPGGSNNSRTSRSSSLMQSCRSGPPRCPRAPRSCGNEPGGARRCKRAGGPRA